MNFRRLKRWIARLEGWFIVFLFCTTFFLALGQIVLRSVFNTSFPWTDPAIRHLVLWVGLWGALWTTKHGNHLKIEIAKHGLPPSVRLFSQLATNGLSAAICAILSWQSIRFLKDEIAYGTESIGGVDLWFFQLVFPAVFTLMAIHFAHITFYYLRISLRPKRRLAK